MKIWGWVLLFFVLCGPAPGLAQEENHLAVDVWGLSHHVNREKGYNEQNWGGGLRLYHRSFFVAADIMRNSVRGQTSSIGAGYDHNLFNIGTYAFSAEVEVAHLDYQVPKRGTARGVVV